MAGIEECGIATRHCVVEMARGVSADMSSGLHDDRFVIWIA